LDVWWAAAFCAWLRHDCANAAPHQPPLTLALCFTMIRRIFNVLTAASLIFFVVLVILAAPSFFDPEIEVVNSTSEVVSVVAKWRSTEKNIGKLESKSTYRFSVDDEAAIMFKVRYGNGKEVETEPLYFTSGINVIAEITSDGIEVRYNHET
jgi:hypothetical protein